jgi:hypothetical protein
MSLGPDSRRLIDKFDPCGFEFGKLRFDIVNVNADMVQTLSPFSNEAGYRTVLRDRGDQFNPSARRPNFAGKYGYLDELILNGH